MKYFFLVVLVSVIASVSSHAQMTKGGSYIGMRLGIGDRENAFAVSLDYDYLWKKEREFGPGSVALGVSVDASFPSSSTTTNVSGTPVTYTIKTTYIPISFHGSYHFGPMMDNKKMDPYILFGPALRYYVVSNSYPAQFSALDMSSSKVDLIFVGCLGFRYSFDPKWAANARLGFGMTFISAGVSYTL